MRHEVKQEVLGQTITMQANMSYRAVRMHHPTLRDCEFTVENQARLYPTPYACPKCRVFHIFKTIHFALDVNGDVTVSEELYSKFKEAGFVETMTAVKEVIPRPFAVGLPMMDYAARIMTPEQDPVPQPPTVVSQEHGLVKVNGHNVGGK